MIEEGNKSNAICFNCKKIVSTTYKYRDVNLSDNSKVIKNILVGVCDICSSIVSTHAETTEEIKQQINDNSI